MTAPAFSGEGPPRWRVLNGCSGRSLRDHPTIWEAGTATRALENPSPAANSGSGMARQLHLGGPAPQLDHAGGGQVGVAKRELDGQPVHERGETEARRDRVGATEHSVSKALRDHLLQGAPPAAVELLA